MQVNSTNENQIIRRTIDWVDKNYSSAIYLEDIATELGYSKFYFCSLFKKYTGTTFRSYLNQVRITKAKRLLCLENISITDIAIRCGFENISYFTQVFRKYTSFTPKEFRNMTRT